MNCYEVVIIGGGCAGLFASSTANFFEMSNLIIEQKPYLGGQPLELYPNKYVYDFPCFIEIKSSDIIKKLIDQQKNGNGEILLSTKITHIEPFILNDVEGYKIHTNNKSNEVIFCKNIIIATGNGSLNPKKLEINGVEIVHDCIHYNVNVSSDIYKNKKIVILGGGDSAVDWANYFVEENISNDITIVHRRNNYRCTSIMVESLTKNKINQKLNYEILNVDTINKIIKIKNNQNLIEEELSYDYLIVQYGQLSSPLSIDLFDQLEKEKNKCIVNINQKTNLKFIYAVGDAIYYEHKANTIVTSCAEATKCIWHISKNKERKW